MVTAAAPSDARARRRDRLDGLALTAFGALGIVAGLRAFRPAPTIAQPAPVVAAPAEGFPTPALHAEKIASYTLHATLDADRHVVDGEGTIELRNTSIAPVTDLRLHLYLNAFKNDRTLFRRARVGGFRGEEAGRVGFIDVLKLRREGSDIDLWPRHVFVSHRGESAQDSAVVDPPLAALAGAPDDETDVSIPLERPVAPGETARFYVVFRDQLPEIVERTGYWTSFHLVGQWFPKLAKLEPDGRWATFAFQHLGEFYADYGDYDISLDVPTTLTTAATGTLAESAIHGPRRIERWLASDVHDFAWTAWDGFERRALSFNGVDVTVLAPRDRAPEITREVASLTHGLADMSARYGQYPYRTLTVVHTPDEAPEAGGMEYPTFITTGGAWHPDFGDKELELVTLHELGHQWFYGLIGSNEVGWPAGDEGLNSYAEELSAERLFGRGTAVSAGTFLLSAFDAFHRAGVAAPFDEPIFEAVPLFADGRSYGRRVYGGTATVLMTLRRTYGADAMDRAMGVYAREQRFRHPGPIEFFAAIARECGADCAENARLALTEPFGLDLYLERMSNAADTGPSGTFDAKSGRVEESVDSSNSTNRASVWIGRRGLVDLPVEVELRFADGTRRLETVRFGTAQGGDLRRGPPVTWRRLDADGPARLVGAVLDPYEKIPLDRDRLDNFLTAPDAPGSTARGRERLFWWVAELVREVGP